MEYIYAGKVISISVHECPLQVHLRRKVVLRRQRTFPVEYLVKGQEKVSICICHICGVQIRTTRLNYVKPGKAYLRVKLTLVNTPLQTLHTCNDIPNTKLTQKTQG